MDIFGVVQSRLLIQKVPLRRRHLIPCVLHLLIFVGRQVTALVRRLAKSVRPSTRVSVQAILHRSGCHIALQGTSEPDGEETWRLLKVWEDLAPLLGGDMRMHTAVVAMYILLGDMYGTMFEEGALQPNLAQPKQHHLCPRARLGMAEGRDTGLPLRGGLLQVLAPKGHGDGQDPRRIEP